MMVDTTPKETSVHSLILYEGGEVCTLLGKDVESVYCLSFHWQEGEGDDIWVVHVEE